MCVLKIHPNCKIQKFCCIIFFCPIRSITPFPNNETKSAVYYWWGEFHFIHNFFFMYLDSRNQFNNLESKGVMFWVPPNSSELSPTKQNTTLASHHSNVRLSNSVFCSVCSVFVCVLGCVIMMGGNEDPNNKGDSPFESSAASQPFLSKPSYPSSTSSAVEEESESNQQYLHITYNSGPRSFKDLPFLILFLLFIISTFAFGIFAVFHRNTNYPSLSSFSYDPTSSSCVLNPSSSSSYLSLWPSVNSSSHLVKGLIWTLVITFVLSIPFCWALLLLLKHYTKQIVYAAIPFFIAIPIFLNVYWFVACTLGSSCSAAFPLAYRIIVMVFVFLVIGVAVWILVMNWHRVELTVSIIGVASHALSRNLNLFGVLPCLIVGLLVYYVPIVVFMVFARFNGKIAVKNLESGYACVWKEDSWVPAYFALAILTMLWSAAAMVEAQVYVISGTIANWYFTKDHETPKRSIRTSLRSALLLLPHICLLISCFI